MDVTAVTSMRYVTKQKGATRGALCRRCSPHLAQLRRCESLLDDLPHDKVAPFVVQRGYVVVAASQNEGSKVFQDTLCGRERFPPAADDASSDNADRSVATKLAGPFAEDPDPEPDPSVVGVPSKGLRGPAGGIFEQTVHALKDFPSQCAIHSLLLIIRMIRTFASHFK